MSEWIYVKDTIPEESVPVLVARTYKGYTGNPMRIVEIAYRLGTTWFSYTDEWRLTRSGDGRPYAWMSLPEAPEEV